MDLDFEFSDRVLGFGTRSNELFVLFQSRAAEYVLSAERDNFAEIVAELAKSWQQRQPVKVCVRAIQILTAECH